MRIWLDQNQKAHDAKNLFNIEIFFKSWKFKKCLDYKIAKVTVFVCYK